MFKHYACISAKKLFDICEYILYLKDITASMKPILDNTVLLSLFYFRKTYQENRSKASQEN